MNSELRIKSVKKEIKAAREFAIEQLAFLNLEEKLKDNIVFCATEAVANAIIHGNHEDSTKYVIITIDASDEKITIQVEDSGKGFDIGKVPDPTIEKNLGNSSGRGIFFIKNMMSSADVSPTATGSVVTMTMLLDKQD